MSNTNRSLNTKTFVLDTNVILHDSTCIYKFEEHDLVIPIEVIEELDTFKNGNETINQNAREFSRKLDEISQEKIFNGGVSIGEGLGTLKIQLNTAFDPKIIQNLDTNKVDTKILNTAYCLQKNNKKKEVILVTKDVNLRLLAKAMGVIAQDFMYETVQDLKILSKKTRNLTMDHSMIDTLFKNKSIKYEADNPLANEYFIVNNGEPKSALVKHRNSELLLVNNKMRPFHLEPKNSEQSFAMDALLDPSISLVVLEGKAGTGKTLLTLACGLQMLKDDKYYESLLFTRQTISMGNHEEGFLPGDINAKISPYMKGMQDNLDVLRKFTENQNFISSLKEDKFSIEPLSLIRGRTLPKVFFIIDEAQNLTPKEIKAIITRAGEGTKIVILGDTKQIDHPYLDERSNGLTYLIKKMEDQEGCAYVHLNKSERSRLAEWGSENL